MLFHINRIERNLQISVCSSRPVSGTQCNAYEQEPGKKGFLQYTHPARHKRSRHPYTQMTCAHCATGRWDMEAAVQRDRRTEAAFQGFGVFM